MRKFIYRRTPDELAADLRNADIKFNELKRLLRDAHLEIRALRGRVSDQAHIIAVGGYRGSAGHARAPLRRNDSAAR
jgi:hypothetical protein